MDDSVTRARTLLAACTIHDGALDDADAVARAESVAAAARDYAAGAAAVLDEHMRDEFELRDADATMATMSAEPYVNHVPVNTGDVGRDAVHRFHRDDFIPNWPEDTTTEPISRTIGADQVVDELILSFTHTREMPAILPGLAPTGRRVELPTAVVVGLKGGLVRHEHIYWDQASALVQLGVLDPAGLPVRGAEQAARMRELTSASES
jgi:carboxymethylenebutenolidase